MKKIIILMITVCGILCGALGLGSCALADDSPEIELDGSIITVTDAPSNSTLIVAVYDNGRLSGVQLMSGSGTFTMDVSQYLEKSEKIKAFLWDMKNIIPLGEPKKISKDEPAVSGAAVILNMNGTDVRAELYDNEAARAFEAMLPYSVTVSRAADDLCGTVSENLPHNSAEDQDTWSIGEIGWFDGWFTILCGNEEGMPKRTRTIIGKIYDEDMAFVQSLTGSVEIKARSAQSEGTEQEDGMININVNIGGKDYAAKLYDNETTRAWTEQFPVTYDMSELNGNEKYKYIDGSLPTNSNAPGTINAGDLMLYGSDCVVLFYKTFNTSYSYTPLGYIEDPSDIASAAGSGGVTVRFEKAN